MTRSALAMSVWLLPAVLLAQGERITVRMAPAPNQTLHLRTTQEMAMTSEIDTPTGAVPPPAMTVSTVIDSTSVVSAADDNGHYTAKMTVETVSATTTMNGKPTTLPGTPESGPTPVIVLSYDQDGRVVDVSTEGMPGASTNAVRQMLVRAMGTVPGVTLSVGESVTVPTALNLPLGGGAVAPMGVSTETRYTLTSITFDGADRVAHLTTHMTSTISRNVDTPARSPARLEVTTSGDGATDVNIDRGIVLHSEQLFTIDGAMQPDAGAAPAKMNMHGTIRFVTDLVK